MIRFDIPEDTFIGGWFMPENIIDKINDYFDSMKHKLKPGKADNKINKDTKDSLDLGVDFNDYEPPFLEYRKSNQHILWIQYHKSLQQLTELLPIKQLHQLHLCRLMPTSILIVLYETEEKKVRFLLLQTF